MPFAGEFRDAMGFPVAGDVVGGFRVEAVHVDHAGAGPGRYEYPTELVVLGKGGKDGVRRAFKELFARRRTIFSEYGNPYQCSCGRMEVQSQGEGRYRIASRGVGARVHLIEELGRFLEYLARAGHLDKAAQASGPEMIVTDYLRLYQQETRRRTSSS